MTVSIKSLVPEENDLLTLDPEELGWVLLTHLNSIGPQGGAGVVNFGKISEHNFFNELRTRPEYPSAQGQVSAALMEAWNWLQREGLLVQDAENPHSRSFFISRRAQRLKTHEDFLAYRKAALLPRGQLHASIATKVYPAFLRGEYDTAVFQAFRELEVAVRAAGSFPADMVGKDLMRAAFRAADPNKNPTVAAGPLTDTTLPLAEQEGMAHLFSGAIALYKNPQSHRNVPTEAIDAAEVIGFASHLLRMVDRLRQIT